MFEQVVLQNGGRKSGRGLVKKEEALIKAIRRTGKSS
jgi:hypothetical protein